MGMAALGRGVLEAGVPGHFSGWCHGFIQLAVICNASFAGKQIGGAFFAGYLAVKSSFHPAVVLYLRRRGLILRPCAPIS